MIELFSTEMKTLDNKRVIIPNSTIFGTNITNYTHHPVRWVDINVGTEYSADIDETRKVLETVATTLFWRSAVAVGFISHSQRQIRDLTSLSKTAPQTT